MMKNILQKFTFFVLNQDKSLPTNSTRMSQLKNFDQEIAPQQKLHLGDFRSSSPILKSPRPVFSQPIFNVEDADSHFGSTQAQFEEVENIVENEPLPLPLDSFQTPFLFNKNFGLSSDSGVSKAEKPWTTMNYRFFQGEE